MKHRVSEKAVAGILFEVFARDRSCFFEEFDIKFAEVGHYRNHWHGHRLNGPPVYHRSILFVLRRPNLFSLPRPLKRREFPTGILMIEARFTWMLRSDRGYL